MAVTVGNVMDRLYREWLSPPGSQPVVAAVSGAQTDADTSLELDLKWLTPEEQFLFAKGALVENVATGEVVRIDSFSGTTATVTRGVFGTTAQAMTDGDEVVVNPTFPRITVLDTLADVIEDLSPGLFGLSTTTTSIPSTGYKDAPADMVGVQKAIGKSSSSTNYFNVGVQFVEDFSPATDNKALFFVGPANATVYLTYRTTFTRPTAETDVLTDLNVDESWQRLIMVGTVAALVGTVDIDALTEEFIAAQLPEDLQVGTGLQLSSALTRHYLRLEQQARRKLARRAPMKLTRNGVVV